MSAPNIDWQNEESWLGSLSLERDRSVWRSRPSRIHLRSSQSTFVIREEEHASLAAQPMELHVGEILHDSPQLPEVSARRSAEFFGMTVDQMRAEGLDAEDIADLESMFVDAFGSPTFDD
jgi:hypothetical protein